MRRISALSFALVMTATLFVHPPLEAATFAVTSPADAVDANLGDGVCDDGTGDCTLRAAIMETNALPGPDAINLPASHDLAFVILVNFNLLGNLHVTPDSDAVKL